MRNFDLFYKKYIKNGSFFTILHVCRAQKLENSSKNQISPNRPSNTDNGLEFKGRKLGKCKFSVKMWVGLQISEEKICIFGKKLVGPENDVEKKCNLWKKFVGGYRITAGTNF